MRADKVRNAADGNPLLRPAVFGAQLRSSVLPPEIEHGLATAL